MWWIIAWVAASLLAGLVIGRAIWLADEQELGQSDEQELEPAP